MFLPRSLPAWLLVCALTCPLGACEASNSAEPADAGSAPIDGGTDAEADAAIDAETDAAMDAATDAAPDGATDAAMDAVDADATPFVCDVTAPRACPDPAPRYADVEPIFAEHCIPCHDGLGAHWPLTSYEHVTDWYDTIRAMMLSCRMPPVDAGTSMQTSERELILTWIRCDYPE
jgi:hypothetical protein